MGLNRWVGCALALSFGSLLFACGGTAAQGAPGVRCGEGTVNIDGECVSTIDPVGISSDAGKSDAGGNGGGGGSEGDAAIEAEAGNAAVDAADANVDLLTACLGNTNVLILEGEAGNPLQSGFVRIEGGNGWSVETRGNGAPSTVVVRKGDWRTTFSTEARDEPLAVATYIDVQRAGEEAANHAGLNVSHNGLACDVVTGRFAVLELETLPSDAAAPSIGNFVATFEQRCDGGPALRGCVHVTGH